MKSLNLVGILSERHVFNPNTLNENNNGTEAYKLLKYQPRRTIVVNDLVVLSGPQYLIGRLVPLRPRSDGLIVGELHDKRLNVCSETTEPVREKNRGTIAVTVPPTYTLLFQKRVQYMKNRNPSEY